MSLINEALKRAKEAQQSTAPVNSPNFPHLHPVVERAHVGLPAGLLPSVTLAVVAMLGLVIIWQLIHPRQVVKAAGLPKTIAAAPKPIPMPVPPPVSAVKSASHPATAPAAKPNPAPAHSPVPSAAPAKPVAVAPVTPHSNAPAVAPPNVATANPVMAVAEPPPKAAPLNLQAIVFHPTRPSALINGRTLFIGDHVSDFRVAAISHRTVTVIKPGKTNVLVLRD